MSDDNDQPVSDTPAVQPEPEAEPTGTDRAQAVGGGRRTMEEEPVKPEEWIRFVDLASLPPVTD
jgi:hypothetical protein